MFRVLLGFIYVLYILIKLSKSSSVSFNETCSDNILCTSPLICSNTSQCICSKSSSIWNNNLNDCFYCPLGWIAWENNHCLSFAVPSEGGLSYEKANQTCHSFSAQLLSINNMNKLKEFEYQVNKLLRNTFSSAVSLYFRLGAWIDRLNIDKFENIWCDDDYEVNSSIFECVYIRRNNLKNNSLCLSRLKCYEEMPFICDMTAISEKNTIENENFESSNQRFIQLLTELAPVALNLLGNLFGTNQQTTPPPPPVQQPAAPQQIIIHQDPLPAAQASSNNNTFLIIGLVFGGIFLLLCVCSAAGLIIYLTLCSKNSSSTRETNRRSSVESTSSNA